MMVVHVPPPVNEDGGSESMMLMVTSAESRCVSSATLSPGLYQWMYQWVGCGGAFSVGLSGYSGRHGEECHISL